MNEMMSYCGLLCSECPAYIATKTNDEILRRNTANEWSVMYAADIEASDINCLGCRSETRIAHCNVCEIRKCAISKELPHCGPCTSFACELLEPVFQHAPDCKTRLESDR